MLGAYSALSMIKLISEIFFIEPREANGSFYAYIESCKKFRETELIKKSNCLDISLNKN